MDNKKTNAVNEALQLPTGADFERDLTKRLMADVPIVLAAFDVDTFLIVNKDFGYAEGDRVLIEVGRHFMANLPKDAALYRFGGDAFNVLFPAEYDKETVFLLMEKLRESLHVQTPDGKAITISIGVAASPEDASQYDELLRKAEGAMMRAKFAGKNRVCLAREEKMVVKTTHYTLDQLQRLTKLSKREGTSEAILLREALDGLFRKYDV